MSGRLASEGGEIHIQRELPVVQDISKHLSESIPRFREIPKNGYSETLRRITKRPPRDHQEFAILGPFGHRQFTLGS
jgi:hypothetical protein